jgi:hypothetical protein
MDEFTEFMSLIDTAASDVTRNFVGDLEHHGGFSLSKIAKSAMNKIGDPKLVLELAIIGALRGNSPKDASEIKLCNGSSLANFMDMMVKNGVFQLTGKGARDKLTLSRLASAFAEPVAQALKKINSEKPLVKRFKMNKLPAYYEFAGFGSLLLSPKMRQEHLIFSHELSKLISGGGVLDEEIYGKMSSDAVSIRSLEVSDSELLDFARPTEDVKDLCRMIDSA